MRPLKLELEGFTAFRGPTCLDLRDLDLFAITGPTGAGKSSLIDAISYALYGRVPRVANEVGACISQGVERMRVALEFLAGEDKFRVYRETRRKGAPNQRLDRWQDGEWRALADRAADVTAHVAQIVGLDYDGFTRSVLLPQGQFAEFLAGAADKRRAVLRSLLRLDFYERMRARAGAIAAELKTRLDERERELAGLAEATPENRDRLEAEVAEKRREAERLQAESLALADGLALAQALSQARDRLCAAEAEATAAQEALVRTRALVEDGDAQLAALAKRLAEAESQLAANRFEPQRLAQLTLALGRAQDLARCLEDVANAEALRQQVDSRVSELAIAAEEQGRRHAAAERALQSAEEALEEAKRHDLAATLQRGLKPGDRCPVCGGAIGAVPAASAGDSLEAAQQRFEAARKAESGERGALQAALTAATQVSAQAQAAAERVEELDGRRLRLTAGLAEALPEGAAPSIVALEAALKEQTEAGAQRQRLEEEARGLAGQVERLKGELDRARQELAALAQRAAGAAQSRESARSALQEPSDGLAQLAGEAGWPEVAELLRSGADVSAALRERLASAQARQQETALVIGQTEERLKRLEQDIEKAKGLRRDLARLKEDHGVAADLALMLRADRFQAFVQQEALATLAADGSRRLEQLSAGRYRLRVEEKGQEFEVIDQWNADQARSVKTLSGGETFLASLALSLALAESLPGLAAGGRVVLDSIFLDEGFGSLDPEALDRAADALDALRGENRLVCVVTHLQELAQRLPARVLVSPSREGEAGSTISVA